MAKKKIARKKVHTARPTTLTQKEFLALLKRVTVEVRQFPKWKREHFGAWYRGELRRMAYADSRRLARP